MGRSRFDARSLLRHRLAAATFNFNREIAGRGGGGVIWVRG